ncbi:hypothetical protein FOE67_10230 [Streptomyces calidiresistens]|uniref:Uncharacterized protein n=1 Tax=Streptomyces calidiresistens TaxID=1485586 RepID=A0A7W3XWL0_9ACTN|nr:hypothetical protein [Streptomyces calidiresistens]
MTPHHCLPRRGGLTVTRPDDHPPRITEAGRLALPLLVHDEDTGRTRVVNLVLPVEQAVTLLHQMTGVLEAPHAGTR